jgi:hypothetical protein
MFNKGIHRNLSMVRFFNDEGVAFRQARNERQIKHN